MLKYPIFSDEDVKEWLENIEDEDHPFNGFVGSQGAIQTALDLGNIAHTSKRDNYCDRRLPAHILLIGRRSAGKTEFYRRFSRMLGTPSAEIDGTGIVTPELIVDACKRAWAGNKHVIDLGLPHLTPTRTPGGRVLVLPPMSLFVDEVHAMPGPSQDRLLKLAEPKDGILIIGDLRVDFNNVCIVAATTEPGKLKETFKSRFEPRLELDDLTTNLVAQIIQNNNPDWYMEDCYTVATLRKLPRVALAFVDLVKACQSRSSYSVAESIEIVRKRLAIYRNGLNRRIRQILRTLSQYPNGISRSALLGSVEGLDKEEFDKEILPLMSGMGDSPPLIVVSNRHRITSEGWDALEVCDNEEEELSLT